MVHPAEPPFWEVKMPQITGAFMWINDISTGVVGPEPSTCSTTKIRKLLDQSSLTVDRCLVAGPKLLTKIHVFLIHRCRTIFRVATWVNDASVSAIGSTEFHGDPCCQAAIHV